MTTYALHRPDGNWSIMLVNRDETNSHTVRVLFEASGQKRTALFDGPTTLVTFGSQQYVWINDGPNSHPDPDNPPAAKTFDGNPQTTFTLPPASVNVIRGKITMEK